ncbi:MAG TPA: hypothetical protein VHA75_18535, partial [Rugosimonospora sp.]|nr:hypothetical protein [Rugosimonospora sp.]
MSEVDEEPLPGRDPAPGANPAHEPADPEFLDSEPPDHEPFGSAGAGSEFFGPEPFGRPFEVEPIDGDPFDGEPYDDDLLDGEPLEHRPAARPRRHVGRYVLAAALALVVGAGIVVGPTMWRVYSARHTRLTLPDTVAGLSRDTSPDSEDTATYLRDAVGSSTSLSNPLAAVYDAGGDKTHSVLLFGGTGAIFRPESTLSTVFGLVNDSGDAIQGLRS